MDKKLVLVAIATYILASFHRAAAQQPQNVARIGFLAAPSRSGMSWHSSKLAVLVTLVGAALSITMSAYQFVGSLHR